MPALSKQTINAQLAVHGFICKTLEREFESGSLTADDKRLIARHWDRSRKDSQVLRLVLDLMEKHERQSAAGSRDL